MKELEPAERETQKRRKGCPLRRGERKCFVNGMPFCFPEGFTPEDLQRIITECSQATSRGEYPNRKLVYHNSR